MNVVLKPGPRRGSVKIPASKSVCHRLFILAATGADKNRIICGAPSKDISASISCLKALGAKIVEESAGEFSVMPIEVRTSKAELYCGESGSSLRFLLPLCGIFADEAVFHMEGRLSQRPLGSFCAELSKQGMEFHKDGNNLYCRGQLNPGNFSLPGNESSQYISALLMALPLLKGDSRLRITGELQSEPYVALTLKLLQKAGISIFKEENTYIIPGNQQPRLPEFNAAEGDYSSAAFFLAAGALSEEGISVYGLNPESSQGDREFLNILSNIGAELQIHADCVSVRQRELRSLELDASQIPDLVPAAAALLSLCKGESHIYNAGRLRFKESDRLKTTCAMLKSLGADIEEEAEGLIIRGKSRLSGGRCSSYNDHRIAMAAAVAACGCEREVIIENSEAADKSYPGFWQDFSALKEE